MPTKCTLWAQHHPAERAGRIISQTPMAVGLKPTNLVKKTLFGNKKGKESFMDKQDKIIALLEKQNKLLKEQNLRMAQLQELMYNIYCESMPKRAEGLHKKHKSELEKIF